MTCIYRNYDFKIDDSDSKYLKSLKSLVKSTEKYNKLFVDSAQGKYIFDTKLEEIGTPFTKTLTNEVNKLTETTRNKLTETAQNKKKLKIKILKNLNLVDLMNQNI